MKRLIMIIVLICATNLLLSQIINIPSDYPTIQQGIDDAEDGDTVLVQPGTYYENLYIHTNITLASMFLVTGDTSHVSQTIIDANQEGSVIFIGTLQSIVLEPTVCGFTLMNGTGSSAFTAEGVYGGGVFCEGLQPLVQNEVIPKLTDLIIKDNTAESGGGIACINSSPIIKNTTIKNNSAVDTWPNGYGGGIFCAKAAPTIENVKIIENAAIGEPYNGGGSGGGIYAIDSCNLLLINTDISDNEAIGYSSEGLGGGLLIKNSPITIENSVISSNTAEGIVVHNDISSAIIITNTSIDNNEDEGGVLSGNIDLTNVAIVNNGYGLYLEGIADLLNVTIADDGLRCSGQHVTITNSILYGVVEQIRMLDTVCLTISYSNIQGGQTGIGTYGTGTYQWLEGNKWQDPLFIGSGEHPYQLSEGSPCIDTGTPDTSGLNLPGTDLLGNLRIWDGDNNGSSLIDMGAYEYASQAVKIVKNQNVSYLKLNCFPNPVSHVVNIEFELSEQAWVCLEIYNASAIKITETETRSLTAGKHSLSLDLSGLAAGMYFLHLQTEDKVICRTLIRQ